MLKYYKVNIIDLIVVVTLGLSLVLSILSGVEATIASGIIGVLGGYIGAKAQEGGEK